MGGIVGRDATDVDTLLQQAVAGDQRAAGELFGRFHERLLRMVRLRLDQRLKGRIDSEDIVQETYLDAAQRLPEYAAKPAMSFFVWLRYLAAQKLIDAQRHHLGVEKRNVSREVSLYRGPMPEASSASLAAQLLGRLTSPSLAAIRAETQIKVQEVLNAMDAIDREVLVLRHFEHLSNAETGELLGLTPATASKRYITALKRLKAILAGIPGFEERF
jgi:RNA polymerase sigma-70 factor (ECF subfamily)